MNRIRLPIEIGGRIFCHAQDRMPAPGWRGVSRINLGEPVRL